MATRKRGSTAGKAKRPKAKRTVAKKRVRKAQPGGKLVDVARSIGTTLGKVTVKTREMTEKTREAIKAKLPEV